MSGKITIRVATPEDAPPLLAIYAPYVRETAITFEYTVPTTEEFSARIRRTLQKYPYLVAECDSRIVGYAYAGAFKGRAAYDWAVETTVYVERGDRRRGVGRQLYAVLEQLLWQQGIRNVNACIAWPETDDRYLTRDSVAFHERLGYRLVGQFHRCANKFGRWYDMVWMEKAIGDHSENPEPIRAFPDIRDTCGIR